MLMPVYGIKGRGQDESSERKHVVRIVLGVRGSAKGASSTLIQEPAHIYKQGDESSSVGSDTYTLVPYWPIQRHDWLSCCARRMIPYVW